MLTDQQIRIMVGQKTRPLNTGEVFSFGTILKNLLRMIEYENFEHTACWWEYWIAADLAKEEPELAAAYYHYSGLCNMVQKYVAGSTITTSARIENSFYNSYNQYDLRKKVFFQQSSGLWIFKGSYTDGSGMYNGYFSGLATDEMYLNRAECYARIGNTTAAMKDLNTLMKSRWDNSVVFPEFTATDKDDALRQILEERKKELVLRGRRWSDLRRLNKDPQFAQTISRSIGGVTYSLEPNSYRYTFPIPQDEIQQSGIPQNPGWEK